jgi:hypothetical protein
VAARHARRAALELEGHHQQLFEDALAHGESPEEAWRSAHHALGTDETLVERYTSRGELRGWLSRWPVLCAIVPLGSFALLFAAMMAALVLLLQASGRFLHHIGVPEWVALAIDRSVALGLRWLLPMVVAGGFALFAGRRRIALGWLITGALLVCLVAQQMNVGLIIPSFGHRGSASVGIGFTPATFLRHLAWACAMMALALVPYGMVAYRLRLRGSR